MQEIDYLAAIVRGDQAAINRLYTGFFPAVRRLVHDYGGSEADARDVFQDAIMVLYEKVRQPSFRLTSKFSTLLYGTCRNLWWSRQQKKSAGELTIPAAAKYIVDESALKDILQVERDKLFQRALRRLGDDCQKLLELFFQRQSMDEIARAMGYASEGYARVRKSHCKDRLIKFVKSDPQFPELLNA